MVSGGKRELLDKVFVVGYRATRMENGMKRKMGDRIKGTRKPQKINVASFLSPTVWNYLSQC